MSIRRPSRSEGLRLKLLLSVAAACATILALTAAVTRLQFDAIERAAVVEASHVAQVLAYGAATASEPLQKYLEGVDKTYRRDIFIVDAGKRILADIVPSEVGAAYGDDPGNEVGQTIADGRPRTFVEHGGAQEDAMRLIVVPIHREGRADAPIVGAVMLEYSNMYAQLRADEIERIKMVAAAGLIGALAVGLFGARTGNSIARRLDRLKIGVERVAGGRRGVRLAVDAADEIGVLQAAFNRMAEDLEESRARLTAEMEKEKASAQRIEHLAYYDDLTGLPNRALFSRVLQQGLLEARRYQRRLAVMFVDLDRFKNINDTLGHEAGDALLKEVALRLKASLRESDTVARLGGDEFVILLPNSNDDESLGAVAQKILASVAHPYVSHDQEFRVTASVGISVYPADGIDEPTLMKHADIAMYQAKDDGKNTYAFYADDLNHNSVERLAFESSLRRALEQNQLDVHYQPKVDCRTRQITGVEALLRWNHPDLGMVPPSKFIPIAEETGLIMPIGRWILHTACAQHVAWRTAGLPVFRMAINLSGRQFGDENLLRDMTAILAETGMDGASLEIEITESVLMQDVNRAVAVLDGFKKLGISLSVDDFGTGYSSLANLKRFPVDTIKVDRSFVRDLPSNQEDRAIADAIISMGRTLGMTVVAEGVETGAQADFLRERGCDQIQGYYYSRPVPAAMLQKLLRGHPVMEGRDDVTPPRARGADSAFMTVA